MTGLTHLDAEGRARMVDVSGKPDTAREAVAAGRSDERRRRATWRSPAAPRRAT